MQIDANDPRLTAYALNELDAEDRREVSMLLETSPDARAAVEEIRQAADALSRELHDEPPLQLTNEQRQAIEQAMETKGRRRWMPLAVAASLLLVAGSLSAYVLLPSLNRARELPRRTVALANLSTIDANRPTNLRGYAPLPARNDAQQPQTKTESADGPRRLTRPGDQSSGSVKVADLNKTRRPMGEGRDKGLMGPSTKLATAGNETPKSQEMRIGTDGIGTPPGENIRYPKNGPGKTARKLVELPDGTSTSYDIRDLDGTVPTFRGRGIIVESTNADYEKMDRKLAVLGYTGSTADTWSVVRKNNSTPKQFVVPNDEKLAYAHQYRRRDSHRGGFYEGAANTEAYARILDNPFLPALKNPLSTFSIDVDTAAYANVRRFLNSGRFPPADAVRIEEMINYFAYDYPQPEGPAPFSVNVEVAECPWASGHRLVRIGLKGKSLNKTGRPACNLVFLIDVSGSMSPQNKLPLLKKALGMLLAKLGPEDRIAIVTYAGASQLALPSTTCNNQATIRHALATLSAGGSTNGGAGIHIAYDVATQHFIDGGVNRVVLATDGDFNVGITDRGELTRLIRQKAQSGVALTVLGFGMGNLKDATLEKLADTGDGNYAYIDTLREAHKVLVEQIGGTLVTIARDVKIQIEFNPQQAQAYRLIGYENRMLAARDFNDDHKDAGEIGAGHTVTALYEVVPVGVNMTGVDPLKYQPKTEPATVPSSKDIASDELLTVKLRYKEPQAVKSRLIERVVTDAGRPLNEASTDFRFAASVASFGMLLRSSPYRGNASFESITQLATQSLGPDANGHRREFVTLVKMAGTMRLR